MLNLVQITERRALQGIFSLHTWFCFACSFYMYIFTRARVCVCVCVSFCLFWAVLCLHCYTQAFSSCGEWGLLASYCARASHCSGFCRALAVQLPGSVVVACGFICPAACGIFQTRSWTCFPCIGRWILNHWPISQIP